MYLTITRDILAQGLQKVLGPTATKQNFPVLNGVKLKTLSNKIKLTATDLDITITTTNEANITTPGEMVVPMKRFFSIIKELPSQEVTLELIKNNLLIRCGKIEFKINTLSTEEFPQTQEPKGVSLIKVGAYTIEEMVRLTSFCVGYEDVNYVLNGILFEIEKGDIKLVATDGKRLAYIKRKLAPQQAEVATKISFILPIKAINELYRLIKDNDGEVLLSVEGNRIGFNFKNTQLNARPIEGEFPNYAQYIPGESKDKLTINRKEFVAAMRRASLLLAPEHQGVTIELKKGSVGVFKNTPQLGEVRETFTARYNGAHFEIGFNPQYLLDVLKNVNDEDVVFDFFGADKPAVFKHTDYTYLVLPMKI